MHKENKNYYSDIQMKLAIIGIILYRTPLIFGAFINNSINQIVMILGVYALIFSCFDIIWTENDHKIIIDNKI